MSESFVDRAVEQLKNERIRRPELTVEQSSQFLEASGHGKVACIGAIAKVYGLGLGQAKHAMHFSEAWAFRRESDEDFHDALFETMEALHAEAETIQSEQGQKK